MAGRALFFNRKRVKLIASRILLPMLFIHSSLGCIFFIRNYIFIKNDVYAAILISDYAVTKNDYWASPLACFGAYPYWTVYFNNRNLKAKWILRATSKDLERVIKDVRCQSIVLVGHGSFNSWLAVDMFVTNKEVEQMMSGVSKKNGEWLQLTCAVEDSYPVKMGELVTDKKNVYTYNGPVNSFIFLYDALFGFKYLKSLNRY